MAVSGFNTPSRLSSVPPVGYDFSGESFALTFGGILSDMDGTLIDSTKAIVKHWESVGKEYNIDPKTILATSHGRRSIDVFQSIDPSRATWERVKSIEREIPLKYGSDAVEIPGARELLTSLERKRARWAIVTSGTRPLVAGWLTALNLTEPKQMVTAEDVQNGKPDPECYLLGHSRLHLPGGSTPSLVLEDAPAGIRAGKSAGCKVLALATTHRVEELQEAGADWIVEDLRSVRVKLVDGTTGELLIEISNTLRL